MTDGFRTEFVELRTAFVRPMSYKKFLRSLRPINWGGYECEPFETYRERASELLSNWPDGPLQDWLYRHYGDAINHYGWLRFDRMIFRKESWSNEQIYGQVNSRMMRDIDGLGANIYTFTERQRSRLMHYFLQNGTWPVPLILLDNRNDIVDPHDTHYGQPYHLLEGHLRLGYFRNIYRKDYQRLRVQHDVWIVTIEQEDIERI